MKIVLASDNAGKVREFSAFFKPLEIEIILQNTFAITSIEETGSTFIENAIAKARHATQISGLPALADDSGLVVDALDGKPGIFSARYAGKDASAQENIAKLLLDLKDVPHKQRTAHFYCVLALLAHAKDPVPLICEGRWSGFILENAQGSNGFGYDPIFFDPTYGKSGAELSLALKNQISHRAHALKQLQARLRENV